MPSHVCLTTATGIQFGWQWSKIAKRQPEGLVLRRERMNLQGNHGVQEEFDTRDSMNRSACDHFSYSGLLRQLPETLNKPDQYGEG